MDSLCNTCCNDWCAIEEGKIIEACSDYQDTRDPIADELEKVKRERDKFKELYAQTLGDLQVAHDICTCGAFE